jgi:hypothetical protein
LVGTITQTVYHVVSAPLLSDNITGYRWSDQMKNTLYSILADLKNSSGYLLMDIAANHKAFFDDDDVINSC